MKEFWKNKKVFVTGHTGFKGSWLTLWLSEMGAQVKAYSLPPSTTPSLFEALKIEKRCESQFADIRNKDSLFESIKSFQPEIVFHLAAQPLVINSFENPTETYDINVMGLINVLESCRFTNSVRCILNVTSDKCYENKEWIWGYREYDPMGGADPYSNSKGCAELITRSYQKSFFTKDKVLVSARSGNIIGGGDWSLYRLIPDAIRAFTANEELNIRMPDSVRPWQHVVDPLRGYLLLAQKAYESQHLFEGGYNFGPPDQSCVSVKEVMDIFGSYWSKNIRIRYNKPEDGVGFKESKLLKLDCSYAKAKLGWSPKIDLHKTLKLTCEWYKHFYANEKGLEELTLRQIFENGFDT